MSVNAVGRADDGKWIQQEHKSSARRAEDITDSLMEKTCREWGVESGYVNGVIGATYALQEKVRESMGVLTGIQAEELLLQKSIRDLETRKQRALESRSDSLTPRIQAAQTKLDELTENLKTLEQALQAAETEKVLASKVFYAAVDLHKDRTKSSSRKTRLNREWPGIQQAKSRADAACQRALENFEAGKAAVSDQRSRLYSLQEQRIKDEPSNLDERIEELKGRLEFTRKRWSAASREIGLLSDTVNDVIELFITDHIDPADKDLQCKVRLSLQKLKVACIKTGAS